MQATQKQSATHPNLPEQIEVVPSGAALGAEIRGMDLSRPVPEATRQLLRRAWADHLVLFWRGQNLPDESLLDAAQIFGATKEPAARKYQVAGGYKIGGKLVPLHPHLTLISNLDENGVPVKDNGSLGSYEVVWHSDNSYVQVPPAGSMLYSVVIPVNGGGDTWFNNQYMAYDELPEDLKAAIKGKLQIHDATAPACCVRR
jgi:taurine dioxygenase